MNDERHAWRPSRGYLAAALLALVGGVALVVSAAVGTIAPPTSGAAPAPTPIVAIAVDDRDASMARTAGAPRPSLETTGAPEPDAVARLAPAHPAVDAALPATAPAAWQPGTDPTPDLASVVNPGEAPSMAEVIDRLHAAGVTGGLGAFSPPGTRPPLVGLAVPEDYAIPEGYVRHYQATDDGQRIEPILMYAPDARFVVDANGQALAIPADRVVPPELAPPGLPLRRIVVPAPLEPLGRPRR